MGNQALLEANGLAGDRIWLWHEKQIMNSLDCIIIYFVLSPGTLPVTSEHSVCCTHRRRLVQPPFPEIMAHLKQSWFICLPNPFYRLSFSTRFRSLVLFYCLGLMQFQITLLTILQLLLSFTLCIWRAAARMPAPRPEPRTPPLQDP